MFVHHKDKGMPYCHLSLVYTNLFLVWLWNKQLFAYVNHAQIRSWNQPVLNNESEVSYSRKQRRPLLGLKLTTDRYPPITSQTRYPLRHAAFELFIESYMSCHLIQTVITLIQEHA